MGGMGGTVVSNLSNKLSTYMSKNTVQSFTSQGVVFWSYLWHRGRL